MTDAEKRKKVIRGLEAHVNPESCETCAGEDCPYHNEGGSYPILACSSFLASDALALLREQEPRVMTPKEVDEQAFNPVWLEVESIGLLEPALFRYARPEYMKFAFSLKDNRAIERDASEYGLGWRCWTSRPTPEQMRDTKWEGENETM